ncbi:hypothetical protein JW859_01875 [bacterium]|nr:hypothetical protein [bacterium]
MMGWELTNFRLDRQGYEACAFHFEVVFTGSLNQPECLYRGDGILTLNGRVRVNREDDLKTALSGVGVDPHSFIKQLVEWVGCQASLQPA